MEQLDFAFAVYFHFWDGLIAVFRRRPIFFGFFFLANFRGVFLIGHPVVPRDFTRWIENCARSSTGFRGDVKPGSNSSRSVSPAKTTICTVSRGRLRRRNQTKGNLPLAFRFVMGFFRRFLRRFSRKGVCKAVFRKKGVFREKGVFWENGSFLFASKKRVFLERFHKKGV